MYTIHSQNMLNLEADIPMQTPTSGDKWSWCTHSGHPNGQSCRLEPLQMKVQPKQDWWGAEFSTFGVAPGCQPDVFVWADPAQVAWGNRRATPKGLSGQVPWELFQMLNFQLFKSRSSKDIKDWKFHSSLLVLILSPCPKAPSPLTDCTVSCLPHQTSFFQVL